MATNISINLTNLPNQRFPDLCHFFGPYGWNKKFLTFPVFVAKIVSISSLVLTCPFTVLMNLMVILAVKRKRYLKKNHHVLLACLAGTDLFVGVGQPLMIASNAKHVLGGEPICLIDFLGNVILSLPILVSIGHLVIISGERYIAIKHALRYESIVTTRRLAIAVAVAWLLPTLGYIMFYGTVEAIFGAEAAIFSLNAFTFFLLFASILTISFCQYSILLESRRHRKHIRLHAVSESSAKIILQRDKAARTTTILVAAVFLCYTPAIAHMGVVVPLEPSKSVIYAAMSIVDIFLFLSSFINPVIYCARTQEFKKAFREFLSLKNTVTNAQDVRGDGSKNVRRWRTRVSPHTTKRVGRQTSTARRPRSRSQDLRPGSLDEARRRRIISL